MNGHVYFVRRPNGDIKIGWASDVPRRLQQLRSKLKVELVLLATFQGNHRSEHALHKKFSASRQNGEWFLPVDELLTIIRDCEAGCFVDPSPLPTLPLSTLYGPRDDLWTDEDAQAVIRPVLAEMIAYHADRGHQMIAVDMVAAACGVSSTWIRRILAGYDDRRTVYAHNGYNILDAYAKHQATVRADAVETIRLASLRQADVERALATFWPSLSRRAVSPEREPACEQRARIARP